MGKEFVVRRPLPEFGLWEKMEAGRAVFSFDFEATSRCNLDCRHCYINRPAGDRAARKGELTVDEIGRIGAEAASLGAVWCLVTGGEPLLRRDFFDVYQALLSKGLLISLFTNATLVTKEHVRFFQKYPPRDIEVTVYGVTRETYERVTRTPGSFAAFQRGLDLLLAGGVTVRLKAMALRSNKHEIAAIGEFCRAHGRGQYRFDPQLHLRFDRDEARNALIRAERLSPREVARLERSDPERFGALTAACGELLPDPPAEGPGGSPAGTSSGAASAGGASSSGRKGICVPACPSTTPISSLICGGAECPRPGHVSSRRRSPGSPTGGSGWTSAGFALSSTSVSGARPMPIWRPGSSTGPSRSSAGSRRPGRRG